jgi:broad specificity phosphatase PhoE
MFHTHYLCTSPASFLHPSRPPSPPDAEGKQREKAERLRFGRFFYRFPNGESGADVYDRITVFMDHLVRDINAGRFPPGTSLVLVTHGLALR